jgi:transitional endoplasmic reticulum ATPase
MPRHRPALPSLLVMKLHPIVRYWLLCLLVPLGGHRGFIQGNHFFDNGLAEVLGLSRFTEASQDALDQKAVLEALRHEFGQYHAPSKCPASPPVLRANTMRLSVLVGLTDTDCAILEFAVMLHNERLLDDVADLLGQLSSNRVFYVLSVLLDLPEDAIRTALNSQGVLARSGLVSVSRNGSGTLRGKIDLISEQFADHILSNETDPIMLLRDVVAEAGQARLSMADYPHLSTSLQILQPYLRHAITTGRRGVNIFFHGAPGTGKSELSKVLAQELDCELFNITVEDDEGNPIGAIRRLRAFRAAQCFFNKRRVLIAFDEVEEIFNDVDLFNPRSTAERRKSWINRTLEENPVPAIWLSNSIEGLDPAFIRRFDMLIEVPVPPKQQRLHIIESLGSDLIDHAAIVRIADSTELAPAVVERALSVAKAVAPVLGAVATAQAVEQLINNTLLAQGHAALLRHDPARLPDVYDTAFLNADCDLDAAGAAIMATGSARLCLYGPPGTGKTAYGRWLAEKMGAPLHIKRVSDLMSKFIGENERNIANAFRAAEQDKAILMIDEIDSFLQDRRGTQRNWELTLVNEMLTQMENFSGIFLASTNLMSGLDPAALRRFDLKVRFDFLRAEQTAALLNRCCTSLGIAVPQPASLALISCLRNLTPGDFSNVIRQSRLRRITSCTDFTDALVAECRLKEATSSSIGFI